MQSDLRKLAVTEEFDYNFAMSALSNYKNPRVKLNDLLKKKEVIRIKKGLYVFGAELAQTPFSKEALANLIYGPSYISLSYALSFYGLIPERVETITSITNKRNKLFQTPVGIFSYQYLHPRLFSEGITAVSLDKYHQVLIATKEKLFCDILYFTEKLETVEDVKYFLINSLRIDLNELKRLNKTKLKKLAKIYAHTNIHLLIKFIEGNHE